MRQLAPVVSILGLALLSLVVSACGSRSASVYVSSLVPCSSTHRTYGLKPGKHVAPQLLAVVKRPGGSRIYAASRQGLVYASSSRGRTWTRYGRGVEGLPCSILAVDPHSPRVMFAGNGDAIARSTDAGGEWKMITLPGGARATSVIVAGESGQLVYAWGEAGFDFGVPGGPPGGMFVSHDGGVTWEKVARYVPYETSYVGVAPSAPGTAYVGTDSGLFLTTTAGGRWTELSHGLPNSQGQPPTIDAAAVSPRNPSLALVDSVTGASMSSTAPGWMNSDPLNTIFRTTDGGRSWEPSLTHEFGADNGIVFAPGSEGTAYALALRANRSRTNFIGGELYVTHNGGESWRGFPGRVSGPCTYPGVNPCGDSHSIQTLMVDPADQLALYGETEGGRFAKSLDGGRTWGFMPMPPTG